MGNLDFSISRTVLALLTFASSATFASSLCRVTPNQPQTHEDYRLEIYESEHRAQLVLFSKHTTRREDHRLRRLKSQLEANNLSSDQRERMEQLIRADLRSNRDRIQAENHYVEILRREHATNPFQYVAGEFSYQDSDRYHLRIEVANFVRRELLSQTRLNPGEVDAFILFLTGEDVFPLLEGQFLAELPLYPSEDASLLSHSSENLARCFAIRGNLKFSRDETANVFARGLEPFLRPHPDDYQAYTEFRDDLISAMQESGLLRLRARIDQASDIERAVRSCDALFDERRDRFLADRMLNHFPFGRGLITRGIGHVHLLESGFLDTCLSQSTRF